MDEDKNFDEYIRRFVGGSGISDTYIKYDLALTSFISFFFSIVKDSKLDVVLYGGTALNRGFFGEKQRLSVDIDLETRSNRKALVSKIANLFKERKVDSTIPKNSEGLIVVNWENGKKIRIEITGQKFRVDEKSIDLIPLSNYLNLPTAITYNVRSYTLEYLMARKLYALSRRLIYKDMYDAYIGLGMVKKREFKKYVGMVGGDYDIVAATLHYLKKGQFDAKDPFDYKNHAALKYRKSEAFMANEIVNKLEDIL